LRKRSSTALSNRDSDLLADFESVDDYLELLDHFRAMTLSGGLSNVTRQ
jgi:hypothetical protein